VNHRCTGGMAVTNSDVRRRGEISFFFKFESRREIS
jgi:hypothetical protein